MVKTKNDFSLIIGCGGYKYNNIILCSGTMNILIDFNCHFDELESKEIMNFLDNTCNLFDRPMGDWNKIINSLKFFKEKFNLIDDRTYEALYVWFPKHKQCGAYIKLELNEELKRNVDEYLITPNNI